MKEEDLEWVIYPFRGEFASAKIVPALQDALFKGRVEELNGLVINHDFASEELQKDAEARTTRLIELTMGGGIDYIGEGPYPAHWRMDANRGVFHYAGTSAWCWDAYKLLLDMALLDPAPAGWASQFPEPEAGSLESGASLWEFFGDISNLSYEMDTYMAKLFDSFPVWISPPESSFTGFLSEKDVKKILVDIEKTAEGRLQRSFHLRTFHGYLQEASSKGLGITAAAIPRGTRWQDEKPRRIEEHW